MNWFAQQRQDWIAETLRVFGFINRGHLQRKFGISQPQASMDLQIFFKKHPKLAIYDLHQKRYSTTLPSSSKNAGPQGA